MAVDMYGHISRALLVAQAVCRRPVTVKAHVRTHNMELDSNQNRSTTPHRPPLYTGRLDNPPIFPLLAPPPMAGGNSKDHSSPGGIQNVQSKRLLTLIDYIDFLLRAKWKSYQKSPRHTELEIILT